MAEVSLPALAIRLAISMGVVVGLMLVAAKLLRRAQSWAAGSASPGRSTGRTGGRPRKRARVTTTPIAITTITPLARGASVAVVRAAGRELVLGVTETSVTLLHSSSADDLDRLADLDRELDRDLDLAEHRSSTPTAARIAAIEADTPDRGAGMPAWTDALETLRAMTARRA